MFFSKQLSFSLFCSGVFLLHAFPCSADEIELTSGITKTGIIESETDEMVRLRTDVGTTGISRAFIVDVRRDTKENNAALEAQWAQAFEAEHRRREEEAAAARAYAESQRAKGLLLYEGDWLTQAEADLRILVAKQELQAENDRRVVVANNERDAALARVAAAENERMALEAALAEATQAIEALEDQLREQERDLVRTREYWADALNRLRRCQSQLTAVPAQ